MFFINKRKLFGKVNILIPTRFDSRYTIELCLKSIWRHTDYPDYEIIVGNAGVDDITRDYLEDLSQNNKIKLVEVKNQRAPKDGLVEYVKTDFYIIMHDDIKIIRADWLRHRLTLMCKSPRNAIVGSVTKSYGTLQKRFFPLGMLVRTNISRQLNLVWGKREGFDTGALAYKIFQSQREYRFIPYKVSRDIFHFSALTWPCTKNQHYSELERKMNERQTKIHMIKELLEKDAY